MPPTITITEALAEITTIGKRLEKKRAFISGYLYRQEQLKDPLQADGGSSKMILESLQSVSDLEDRMVSLRSAIQKVNSETQIAINGTERSIADWLVWRRDIAPKQQEFFKLLTSRIQNVRQEAARKGVVTVAAEAAAKPGDVIINLSEKWLVEETENLENSLGQLDGALSLKNATTMIAI